MDRRNDPGIRLETTFAESIHPPNALDLLMGQARLLLPGRLLGGLVLNLARAETAHKLVSF
jgi:hypothetical protein